MKDKGQPDLQGYNYMYNIEKSSTPSSIHAPSSPINPKKNIIRKEIQTFKTHKFTQHPLLSLIQTYKP